MLVEGRYARVCDECGVCVACVAGGWLAGWLVGQLMRVPVAHQLVDRLE